jgi:hypothetical protein
MTCCLEIKIMMFSGGMKAMIAFMAAVAKT